MVNGLFAPDGFYSLNNDPNLYLYLDMENNCNLL